MMKLLHEYIRAILLNEITELPKGYFDVIDNAIMDSRFWELPNDDIQGGSANSRKTPAAAALEEAIQTAFNEIDLDIDVIVDSYFTDDSDYMLHPGHPAYPNRWLVDARWYVSKQRPGRNTIDTMLMLSGDDFDSSDVNATKLVNHIAQTIRHELVHYKQMKKQSVKKGLNDDMKAFEEMLEDPSQVPNEDNPKYWEIYEPTGKLDKEGNEVMRKEGYRHDVYVRDYLRSHIEIDAHAHDSAEDLVAVYGKRDALDQLRGGFNLADPELPNAIQHYYEYLPEGDPTIQKFNSKIYRYIQYITEK